MTLIEKKYLLEKIILRQLFKGNYKIVGLALIKYYKIVSLEEYLNILDIAYSVIDKELDKMQQEIERTLK